MDIVVVCNTYIELQHMWCCKSKLFSLIPSGLPYLLLLLSVQVVRSLAVLVIDKSFACVALGPKQEPCPWHA